MGASTRAPLIWIVTLLAASVLATGAAEAKRKKAPPPQSGCCPTCVCGGLMAPAELKRGQTGTKPRSQIRTQGTR